MKYKKKNELFFFSYYRKKYFSKWKQKMRVRPHKLNLKKENEVELALDVKYDSKVVEESNARVRSPLSGPFL